jgi:molecular chaperone DnaK
MAKMVGIDLGTTFSAIAYLDESGRPGMIEFDNGKKTLPSIVAYDGEEIVVGESAQRNEFASTAIRRIKRKMGTEHSAELNGRKYTPEEISAFILKEIKNRAEEALGDKIKDVVITVPAYFNDNQRQATKNAGKIAGLNVLRIINEPTAASLAYGISENDDLNIVVYDLGGGTFDISVLNVADGIFEVISTAGDNELGGEDFTRRIQDVIVKKFKDETGIDLTTDPLAMSKLYDAVESAKIELSAKESARVKVPFITADEKGTHDVDFELRRDEFEKLISDYIERTITLTKQAVSDGKLELSEIDKVILVGGSSRIPMVRRSVNELFGKTPECSLNPEEVVARGAAIQSGIVQGDLSGIVLVDVTPISLGIEVENGYFVPIIERNTPIPTSAKRIFTTVVDNQKSVDISIFQGESMYVSNNITLGKFRLEGIRQTRKGDPRIEVTFELDVNGILNVRAMDLDSESAQGITIVNDTRMTEDQLQKMKENHQKNFGPEIKKRKHLTNVLKMKTKAESIAVKIENAIPPAYRDHLIREEVAEILRTVEEAVIEIDVKKMESAIGGLEFIFTELKAGSYTDSEKIA